MQSTSRRGILPLAAAAGNLILIDARFSPRLSLYILHMAKASIEAEWTDTLCDLEALTEVEIENGGRRFLVRPRAKGATVAVLRCVGARLPVTIRRIDEEPADGKENPAVA